jgi:hypothetical protein
MTRRSDPPVVLVKWYDFTKWMLGHVDNFPKNQRFVFGQRLADGVLGILELIVDATYSDKKSKILLEVNRRLEVLRWLLRLAFDRRHLAAFFAKDLEGLVQDLSQFGKDRAGGGAVCSGRMIANDLKTGPLHAFPERISG